MPFIDWNGSGRLDSQDIATSAVMDAVGDEREDGADRDGRRGYRDEPVGDDDAPGSGCSGCLSTVAMAVGVIFLIGVIIKLFI